MLLIKNWCSLTFSSLVLHCALPVAAATLPFYHCTKSYSDKESSQTPIWSAAFDVDLEKDNFVEEFKPATPVENWNLLVEVNRATSEGSGRPGSEGGPVVVPGLENDEVQFTLLNSLSFESVTVRQILTTQKVYLKYGIKKDNPFQKDQYIEITCKKLD